MIERRTLQAPQLTSRQARKLAQYLGDAHRRDLACLVENLDPGGAKVASPHSEKLDLRCAGLERAHDRRGVQVTRGFSCDHQRSWRLWALDS